MRKSTDWKWNYVKCFWSWISKLLSIQCCANVLSAMYEVSIFMRVGTICNELQQQHQQQTICWSAEMLTKPFQRRKSRPKQNITKIWQEFPFRVTCLNILLCVFCICKYACKWNEIPECEPYLLSRDFKRSSHVYGFKTLYAHIFWPDLHNSDSSFRFLYDFYSSNFIRFVLRTRQTSWHILQFQLFRKSIKIYAVIQYTFQISINKYIEIAHSASNKSSRRVFRV